MQQPELRAGTRIRGVDRLEKDGSNEPEYDKYDNPTISSRGDDSLLFKGSESSKSATSSPPESIILRAPLSHVVERSRTQTICPSLTKVEESVSIPCTPSLTELVSEATKLARAMLTEKVPETKHQQCLENLDRVVTETVDAVNIKLYCHPEQQQFLMPSKEDSKKWLKCVCPPQPPCWDLATDQRGQYFSPRVQSTLFSRHSPLYPASFCK